jgi:hypothetical protein
MGATRREPWYDRNMSRKTVPDHERAAIAAEIDALLRLRDDEGDRLWTTAKLAAACDDLSIETIRKAREPSGVGPAVREAILAVTGASMEELMRKHGVEASDAPRLRRLDEISAAHGTATARTGTGASAANDRLLIARKVWTLLEEDGFERETARGVVGSVALEDDWETELDLYRRVRAALEAASRQTGERSRAERRGAAVKSTGKPAARR